MIVGLEHLTMREMRQLRMGSFFMFQMLLLLARHLVDGGLFVMEHPGPPSQEERASAWTTALAALFRTHPAVVLHVLGQWRWGAEMSKPTGFLALRLPKFFSSMWRRRVADATFPCAEAIGVDEQGRFKTAALKEYSGPLCAALAGAFTDEIECLLEKGQIKLASQIPDALSQWVHEANQSASVVRAGVTYRPDYQGS